MNILLAHKYVSKAQIRNLKLLAFAGSLGRLHIKSKDTEEAMKDNLLTDIGCIERILS